MSSIFDDIIANDSPNNALAPSTLPTQQNSPTPDNDSDSPSDSDSDRPGDTPEGQVNQSQVGTHSPHNALAAFTISTARDLRLTANGEKALIEFSQVSTLSSLIYNVNTSPLA